MRRLATLMLLLVLVIAVQSRAEEEEAPVDEVGQADEGDASNGGEDGKGEESKRLFAEEIPNQFWGTVNASWSMNFTDFNGLRIGGTLNAGLGWFHLGAGYAYTPGNLSYDDIEGDFNISNIFGMIGVRYADGSGQSWATGIHLGSGALSVDVEDEEAELSGSVTVFQYGVYGDYNLPLSESLAFNIHLRTDYLTSSGATTKLYGLGVGLTFYF